MNNCLCMITTTLYHSTQHCISYMHSYHTRLLFTIHGPSDWVGYITPEPTLHWVDYTTLIHPLLGALGGCTEWVRAHWVHWLGGTVSRGAPPSRTTFPCFAIINIFIILYCHDCHDHFCRKKHTDKYVVGLLQCKCIRDHFCLTEHKSSSVTSSLGR